MDREQAQARIDRIHAFRAEVAALQEEGLPLPTDVAEPIAAHHDTLLQRLSAEFDVDGGHGAEAALPRHAHRLLSRRAGPLRGGLLLLPAVLGRPLHGGPPDGRPGIRARGVISRLLVDPIHLPSAFRGMLVRAVGDRAGHGATAAASRRATR